MLKRTPGDFTDADRLAQELKPYERDPNIGNDPNLLESLFLLH